MRSSRVDQQLGQVHLCDRGAGLIVEIRCDVDNQLTVDHKVLLIEYNEETNTYGVQPWGID